MSYQMERWTEPRNFDWNFDCPFSLQRNFASHPAWQEEANTTAKALQAAIDANSAEDAKTAEAHAAALKAR